MFKERAHFGQRQRRVADSQHEVKRRKAEVIHPREQRRQQQAVNQPHRYCVHPPVSKCRQRAAERLGNIQQRRHQQPADKRIAQMNKAALPGGKTLPALRRKIVGFRIVNRLRQQMMMMVRQVRVAVQPVGIPDRQRQGPQQLVKPWSRRGVTVNKLMLQ